MDDWLFVGNEYITYSEKDSETVLKGMTREAMALFDFKEA
jgi:hypothetical protein